MALCPHRGDRFRVPGRGGNVIATQEDEIRLLGREQSSCAGDIILAHGRTQVCVGDEADPQAGEVSVFFG